MLRHLPKPIKRSKYLVKLSHEHHEDLLLVWKIRQGIKLQIEPVRIESYCNWFFGQHLNDHFLVEECSLPAAMPYNHPMLQTMLEDHETIKQTFMSASLKPGNEILEKLAGLLEKHVRYEERELYNYIERTASREQLEKIMDELSRHNLTHDEWKDEFWIHPHKN